MIKAWKSIIDTAGHYSRPDIVRLVLNRNAPSQEPLVAYRSFFEGISPRALADAADRHGVDAPRVEHLLQSSLSEPARIANKPA